MININSESLIISRNKRVVQIFWVGIILQLVLIFVSPYPKETLLIMFSIGFITNLVNTILLYKEKWISITPYIATFFIFFYITFINFERSHVINFTFLFLIPVAVALFHNYKLIVFSTIFTTIEVIFFFLTRSQETFSNVSEGVFVYHYVAISLLIGIFSLSSYQYSQKLIEIAKNNQTKAERSQQSSENVLKQIKTTVDELNNFNHDLHSQVQELNMLSESAEVVVRNTTESMRNETKSILDLHHFIQSLRIEDESNPYLQVISDHMEQIAMKSEKNLHSMEIILGNTETKIDKTRYIVSGFENIKNELEQIHNKK